MHGNRAADQASSDNQHIWLLLTGQPWLMRSLCTGSERSTKHVVATCRPGSGYSIPLSRCCEQVDRRRQTVVSARSVGLVGIN